MLTPHRIAAIAAASLSITAFAQTAPFTETFDAGSAGWVNGQFQPLATSPAGGVGGSAFVSSTANMANDTGTGVVAFRASPTASGGGFTGNYLSGGIDTLSLWVRHDAGEDLGFFLRVTGPIPFPGAFFFAPVDVPTGQWTQLVFDLDPTSPLFGAESNDPAEWPAIFDQIFSNVGNLQLAATKDPASSLGVVTIDLDEVSIIPAPGVAGLLAAAGFAGLHRRRRQG